MPLALPLLAVTAVGATAGSLYFSAKANSAQQKGYALQKKQADLSAARQRRETIRASRIAYAQSQQTASNQGVSGSSASEGGLASIFSQMDSNLSFLDQSKALGDQAAVQIGKANQASYYSGVFGKVASLATTAVTSGGGSIGGSLQGIFKPAAPAYASQGFVGPA